MTPVAAAAPVVLVVLLVAAGAAAPASLVLGAAEREVALAAGQRSVTSEAFDDEWRVTNAAGESVTVITPFHRVALAARHAAFRNEPLARGEPERVLKEHGDRLVFWVHLKGATEGFARFYAPRLLVNERELPPAFVQNERTALPAPGGRFVARCVYGFPTADLNGKARVALLVRDGDGREVSRFTIDLGSMR